MGVNAMLRTRLLFSKTGRAKYISHLDLMRTFQRVFLRANVKLRHSEGFNPHPYMNFALPLSVGIESVCELLDFDLADELDLAALPVQLNKTMPEGIEALSAYQPAAKFADIAFLEIEGSLVYDKGVRESTEDELASLFSRKELVISKKSKKGYSDTNIIPCIRRLSFIEKNSDELMLNAVITAQNPSLNPDNLIVAIKTHLPEFAPDFAAFKRIEVLDSKFDIYR
jgi:radical SAM-linked protein